MFFPPKASGPQPEGGSRRNLDLGAGNGPAAPDLWREDIGDLLKALTVGEPFTATGPTDGLQSDDVAFVDDHLSRDVGPAGRKPARRSGAYSRGP